MMKIGGLRISNPNRSVQTQFETKDHMKENVKRMRQIQRQLRNKEESNEPVKSLWKSTKYENVQSKIQIELEKEHSIPRPESSNFLRAHSRTGYSRSKSRPTSVEPPEEKLTVPKATISQEVNLIRKDIDFIKANGKSVKYTTIKRSPSVNALDQLNKHKEETENNYQKGSVPKYLQNRQKEWKRQEDDKIANIPDPDLPAGHRLMAKVERLEMLDKLKKTEKDLNNQIACMPVRNDTLTIRRKREELERKMAEVEEAIKIFSRPKVFVRLEG